MPKTPKLSSFRRIVVKVGSSLLVDAAAGQAGQAVSDIEEGQPPVPRAPFAAEAGESFEDAPQNADVPETGESQPGVSLSVAGGFACLQWGTQRARSGRPGREGRSR